MKLRYGLVLLIGTASVLLAGCAGGTGAGSQVASASGAPSTSAEASGGTGGGQANGGDPANTDAMVAYAKCMRANGIDMPDPTPGSGGTKLSLGDKDPSVLNKAMAACRKYLPNGGADNSSATMERNLKLAKCLREHGLNVPDPSPQAPALAAPDSSDPNAAAAMKACAKS